MANYVRCRLKMNDIGSKTELYRVGDDGRVQLDFNALIPMPKELNMEAGSTETDAIAAVIRECSDKDYLGRSYYMGQNIDAREERLNATAKRLGGMQNLLELGLKYISNIVHYGFSTWYGWRIAKWGTKWNAAETHIVNRDTVEFWTAWSMPEPIFAELSKRYPDDEIEVTYADENIGENAGYVYFLGGEGSVTRFDSCSQEAYEAYVDCWDEDERLYQD